jgi:RNA polymerase sigma-70 factor (ECF subfamily)
MLATVRPVPSDDPRSDADLLAAHVAGDRGAFAELFRRHHPRLLRLARGRSRSAEDADDALQEAMLSAHRSAAAFRRDAAVGSWLHRIVVNACTDRLRRSRTRVEAAIPLRPAVPDHATAVESALVVQRALLELPTGQRAAVLAGALHGDSVTEAAALLGVAPGTVKSRRARGRARLAGILAAPPVSTGRGMPRTEERNTPA